MLFDRTEGAEGTTRNIKADSGGVNKTFLGLTLLRIFKIG